MSAGFFVCGQSHKLVVDVREYSVSTERLIVPPKVLKTLPGIQRSKALSMIVLVIVHHLCPKQGLYTSLESADVAVNVDENATEDGDERNDPTPVVFHKDHEIVHWHEPPCFLGACILGISLDLYIHVTSSCVESDADRDPINIAEIIETATNDDGSASGVFAADLQCSVITRPVGTGRGVTTGTDIGHLGESGIGIVDL